MTSANLAAFSCLTCCELIPPGIEWTRLPVALDPTPPKVGDAIVLSPAGDPDRDPGSELQAKQVRKLSCQLGLKLSSAAQPPTAKRLPKKPLSFLAVLPEQRHLPTRPVTDLEIRIRLRERSIRSTSPKTCAARSQYCRQGRDLTPRDPSCAWLFALVFFLGSGRPFAGLLRGRPAGKGRTCPPSQDPCSIFPRSRVPASTTLPMRLDGMHPNSIDMRKYETILESLPIDFQALFNFSMTPPNYRSPDCTVPGA